MSGVETRNIHRDSLFLMAEVRLEGEEAKHRVKVRNLSAGGMMAEGGPTLLRGARVAVELRNIGWVEGTVAWVQENRCGIAFTKEIEPKLARAPVGTGDLSSPRFTRPSSIQTAFGGADEERLRRI